MMADQKNLVLAIVLSVVILMGYQFFYAKPQHDKQVAQQQTQQQTQPATGTPAAGTGGQAQAPSATPQLGVDTSSVAGGAADTGPTREQALKMGPRIKINSPTLVGSMALTGARIGLGHSKNESNHAWR